MASKIPTSGEVLAALKDVLPALTGVYDAYKQQEQQLASARERLAAVEQMSARGYGLLEDALSLIESEEGDYSGWRARCRAFLAEYQGDD